MDFVKKKQNLNSQFEFFCKPNSMHKLMSLSQQKIQFNMLDGVNIHTF